MPRNVNPSEVLEDAKRALAERLGDLSHYRQAEFPTELLEHGWKADPADWIPPANLRVRVMDSFDRYHQQPLLRSWSRLATAGIKIPLPLVVTTAGLVITFGTWSAMREPSVEVINTSYVVPGPSVVVSAPLVPASMPQSNPKGTSHPNLETVDRTPIMRGNGAKSAPVATGLEDFCLSPGKLRLLVDDNEVAASPADNSGTALWVNAGASGGFVLTLYPTPEAGATPTGTLEGKTFQFTHAGTVYRVECDRRLLVKEGKSLTVWVRYLPAAGGEVPYRLGCSDNPAEAVKKLETVTP